MKGKIKLCHLMTLLCRRQTQQIFGLPSIAHIRLNEWMLSRWKFIAFLYLFALTSNGSAATRAEANVPIEITLTAKSAHTDPFNDTIVDVVFTEPDGNKLRVPAFWDGEG